MLDGYSKHGTSAYRRRGSRSKHDVSVAPEAPPPERIRTPSTLSVSARLPGEGVRGCPLTTRTTTTTTPSRTTGASDRSRTSRVFIEIEPALSSVNKARGGVKLRTRGASRWDGGLELEQEDVDL
ncbi:hypothetical protein KM043_006586 [Ampulex compressa]|nr:hypothetical protein KM043_006586 [Ampulex compressa]